MTVRFDIKPSVRLPAGFFFSTSWDMITFYRVNLENDIKDMEWTKPTSLLLAACCAHDRSICDGPEYGTELPCDNMKQQATLLGLQAWLP